MIRVRSSELRTVGRQLPSSAFTLEFTSELLLGVHLGISAPHRQDDWERPPLFKHQVRAVLSAAALDGALEGVAEGARDVLRLALPRRSGKLVVAQAVIYELPEAWLRVTGIPASALFDCMLPAGPSGVVGNAIDTLGRTMAGQRPVTYFIVHAVETIPAFRDGYRGVWTAELAMRSLSRSKGDVVVVGVDHADDGDGFRSILRPNAYALNEAAVCELLESLGFTQLPMPGVVAHHEDGSVQEMPEGYAAEVLFPVYFRPLWVDRPDPVSVLGGLDANEFEDESSGSPGFVVDDSVPLSSRPDNPSLN